MVVDRRWTGTIVEYDRGTYALEMMRQKGCVMYASTVFLRGTNSVCHHRIFFMQHSQNSDIVQKVYRILISRIMVVLQCIAFAASFLLVSQTTLSGEGHT